MKLNKKESTEAILKLAAGKIIPCVKLPMDNIVFPKWSDLGLVGMMFRQCVSTKEQPTGNIYDEAKFQTVMRILGGKVLMTGRPDAYCWKLSKVEKAKNARLVGTNSAEAVVTLCEVIPTIVDPDERMLVADMFANLRKDLLLVSTPAENRMCIEVTSELQATGLVCCVDEWMETDADGKAETTILNIGDFLIVTKDGVYCIRREEFLETHRFN